MKFSLIDNNVSKTTNVFLVIANIINLVYNIPQIVKTCKSKSTKDFSGWFLSLRFIGNIIWIGYAIEVNSLLMLINNIVTVIASGIIGGIMINNMYIAYKIRNYKQITDTEYDVPIQIINVEHALNNSDMNKQNELDTISLN
jgi:uncharacterized protein with PQ loop repeat